MNETALSVVVIGRNEGKRLTLCLESIRSATDVPTSVELIYVDSNSTDDSPARAKSFGAKVIVLDGGKMSAARARNAGWRVAAAPFILFLDGDTILRPGFVRRAMGALEDPVIAVVWGNRREIMPEASIYNRVLDLDWIARSGYSDFCGGDSLVRREMLERTGGFNPDLIAGEEPDLCRRMRALGGKIFHVNAPMTGHDLALRCFSQYWRRAVRTGHAYAEISSRYRNTDDPLWGEESFGNFLRGSLYISALPATAFAAIARRSWVPLVILALAVLVLSLRTAYRSRWKSNSLWTLILFAIHSHIQHVPILQGQILYLWGRWRGQRQELIDYKSS